MEPKFLWIGGLAGSGCCAIRSLLDDHPDILAFPFELTLFFKVVDSGFYGVREMEWFRAVDFLLPLLLADGTFSQYSRIEGDLELDREKFLEDLRDARELGSGRPARFELESFLLAAFFAIRRQWPRYRDRTPRYFCLLVGSCFFPWEERSIRERSSHLIPYRDWMTLYESHRNFDLISDEVSLAKFVCWKSVRYTSMLKKTCDNLKRFSNPRQFRYFDFEAMRSDVATTMRDIAGWLDIEYQESLTYLTVMGVPEDGCMADGSRPGKRISPRPSVQYLRMTVFESELHAQGLTCRYPELAPMEPRRLGLVSAVRLAARSALEAPDWDLSGRIRFRFPAGFVATTGRGPDESFGETVWRSRKALISEFRKKQVSGSEGRRLLAEGAVTSRMGRGTRRVGVFLAFCWSYLTLRLAPEPQYLGFLTQAMMRFRIYFWALSLRQRVHAKISRARVGEARG